MQILLGCQMTSPIHSNGFLPMIDLEGPLLDHGNGS